MNQKVKCTQCKWEGLEKDTIYDDEAHEQECPKCNAGLDIPERPRGGWIVNTEMIDGGNSLLLGIKRYEFKDGLPKERNVARTETVYDREVMINVDLDKEGNLCNIEVIG